MKKALGCPKKKDVGVFSWVGHKKKLLAWIQNLPLIKKKKKKIWKRRQECYITIKVKRVSTLTASPFSKPPKRIISSSPSVSELPIIKE